MNIVPKLNRCMNWSERIVWLPLAAGINEGGHYFRYFGPSGVRVLPLAAGINEGGHYFRYFWSERRCADGV